MVQTASPTTLRIARDAFARHERLHPLAHYTGILSLHGLARLAVVSGDPDVLVTVRDRLRPFVAGEVRFRGNFPNYFVGGNGAALLAWQGLMPEAVGPCRVEAERILTDAPRDGDGILCMPGSTDRVWIDAAFAVTPFLLFTGLATGTPVFVEEAFSQVVGMASILRDPANGLMHQSRGFVGPGQISQDHWSRGNGWALLAMAELAAWLPANHVLREAADRLLMDLLTSCLSFQDADGVWHQELTEPGSSYVETSGTGLILFALGVALQRGLLPESCKERLVRGLRTYRTYIDDDGTVRNTCTSCLSPDGGTIAAYKAVPHITDDFHAFGPVILAFGQAHHLGILTVESGPL